MFPCTLILSWVSGEVLQIDFISIYPDSLFVLRITSDPVWRFVDNKSVLTTGSLCYRPFLGGDPGVILTLCGFVFFTTGRFILSPALLFVLVFVSPFSIVITSLGEEKAGLCTSREFVFFILHALIFVFLWFFSSLPVGVGGWLWLVIAALSGLFCYPFYKEDCIGCEQYSVSNSKRFF